MQQPYRPPEYFEAPVYKIEGVPAYIAGEWPGQKTNKFERTKKCIKSNDMKDILLGCDFFNQNPRKKHFNIPLGREKEFKPCMRIFKQAYYTSKDIDREIDLWPSKKSELMINLEPKKHYFQYKDAYVKELLKKHEEKERKIYVKDEMQYLSKIGLMMQDKKEFAMKVEEGHIENNSSYKKNENKYKTVGSIINKKKKHDYLSKRREMAIKEMKIKMEGMKKDIDYIKELNAWDDKFVLGSLNDSG